MKAIILAAGIGERMRPLTNNLPKPMLPINKKPVLEYTLKLLKKHGINEVLITTFYLKEKIINYFGDGRKLGMKISYLQEKELIPSARALKQVETFVDDEVLIIFGDIITDTDLTKLINFHKEKEADITITTYLLNPGYPTAIVSFDKNSKLTYFIEKLPKEKYDKIPINKRLVNGGIFIFKKNIFDNITKDSDKNISDIIESIYKKQRIFVYKLKKDDYLIEIGNMQRYLNAKNEIESGKVKLRIEENKKKYEIPISFFIPAYNEEGNLKEVSEDILKFLENNFLTYELILVINVSKDNTLKIAEELEKKHKNIRVVEQKKFVGYGKQIGTGWENAKNDIIFYTDSDRQFNVNELNKFMPYIKNYDIVIGYREKRQDPFMRIVYSKLYNLTLRFLLGLNFKDVDCAFKLCKKQVVNKIKPIVHDRGGDAEFLVKAKSLGFRIKELPVTHRPRIAGVSEAESSSKGFFVKIKPEIIKALIKEVLELISIKADFQKRRGVTTSYL